MANSQAIRADDSVGVLLNIATLSATEDAITKQWQRIVISDPSTPAQHAAVTATSALYVSAAGTMIVSAMISAGASISAQLSAGGAVSAYPAGTFPVSGLVSAQLSAGGVVTAVLSAGGAVSAYPAGTFPVSGLVSAQLSAGGVVTAVLSAGGAVSAYIALAALSSFAFEASATTSFVTGAAASAIYVYAIRLTAEASGGWHRWAASGAGISGIDGYQRADTFGGYVETVTPPAYLFKTSAGTNLILQVSSIVSALAGRVSFWQV